MEALARRAALVRLKLHHWDTTTTQALTQDHHRLRPKRETERVSQHVNQHFQPQHHNAHREITGRGLKLTKKQVDEAVSDMLKNVARLGVSGATAFQLEIERLDVARSCLLLLQLENWLDIAGGNDFLNVPPLHLGVANVANDVIEEALRVVKLRFATDAATVAAAAADEKSHHHHLLQQQHQHQQHTFSAPLALSSSSLSSAAFAAASSYNYHDLLLKIESDIDMLLDSLCFTCSVDRRLLAMDHGYCRLIDICCSVRVRKAVSSEREAFLATFDQSAQQLRNTVSRLMIGYSTFLVYNPPTYAVIQQRFDAVCQANRMQPLSVSVKHSLTDDPVASTVKMVYERFRNQVPESLVVLVTPIVPDAILGLGRGSSGGGSSGGGGAAAAITAAAAAAAAAAASEAEDPNNAGNNTGRGGPLARRRSRHNLMIVSQPLLGSHRDAKVLSIWKELQGHESRAWAKRFRRSGAAGRYASLLVIQRSWRKYLACKNAMRLCARMAVRRAQRRAVAVMEQWFRRTMFRREMKAVLLMEAELRRKWVRDCLERAGYDVPSWEAIQREQRQLQSDNQDQSITTAMNLSTAGCDQQGQQQCRQAGISGRLRPHEMLEQQQQQQQQAATANSLLIDISAVSSTAPSQKLMLISALRAISQRRAAAGADSIPRLSAGHDDDEREESSSSITLLSPIAAARLALSSGATASFSPTLRLSVMREQSESIVFCAARRIQSFFFFALRYKKRQQQQQQKLQRRTALPPLSRDNVAVLSQQQQQQQQQQQHQQLRPSGRRSALLDRYRHIRREQRQVNNGAAQHWTGDDWQSSVDGDDGDGDEGADLLAVAAPAAASERMRLSGSAHRGPSLAPSRSPNQDDCDHPDDLDDDDEHRYHRAAADEVVRRIRRASQTRQPSPAGAASAAVDNKHDSSRSTESFTFLSLLHNSPSPSSYAAAAAGDVAVAMMASSASADPNNSTSVVSKGAWLRQRMKQSRQHQKKERKKEGEDEHAVDPHSPILHLPVSEQHLLEKICNVPKVFSLASNGALQPPQPENGLSPYLDTAAIATTPTTTSISFGGADDRKQQQQNQRQQQTAEQLAAQQFSEDVEKLENHSADDLALAAMRNCGSRLLACAVATFLIGQHQVEMPTGFTAVQDRPRWVLEELHELACSLHNMSSSLKKQQMRAATSIVKNSSATPVVASGGQKMKAAGETLISTPPRVLSSDDDEILLASSQKAAKPDKGNLVIHQQQQKEFVDRNALLSPCRANRLKRRHLLLLDNTHHDAGETSPSPSPNIGGGNRNLNQNNNNNNNSNAKRFYKLTSAPTSTAAVSALFQYPVQHSMLRHPYQNWSNATQVLRQAVSRGLRELVEILKTADLRTMFQFNDEDFVKREDDAAAACAAAAGGGASAATAAVKTSSTNTDAAVPSSSSANSSNQKLGVNEGTASICDHNYDDDADDDDGAKKVMTKQQGSAEAAKAASLAERQRAQALDSTLQLLCETAGCTSLGEAMYVLSTDISKLVADENRPIVSILRTVLALESRRLIVPWLVVVGAAAEFSELDPELRRQRRLREEHTARKVDRDKRRAGRALEVRLRALHLEEMMEKKREQAQERRDADIVMRHQRRVAQRAAVAERRKKHAERKAERAIEAAKNNKAAGRRNNTNNYNTNNRSPSSSSSVSSVSSVISSVSSSAAGDDGDEDAAQKVSDIALTPLSSISATTSSPASSRDNNDADHFSGDNNDDDYPGSDSSSGSSGSNYHHHSDNDDHDDGAGGSHRVVFVDYTGNPVARNDDHRDDIDDDTCEQQHTKQFFPRDPFAALDELPPHRGGAVFTDEDAEQRRYRHFTSVALAALKSLPSTYHRQHQERPPVGAKGPKRDDDANTADKNDDDDDDDDDHVYNGFTDFRSLLSRPHSLIRKWLRVPLPLCVAQPRRLKRRVDLLLLGALFLPFLKSLQLWFEGSFVLSEEDQDQQHVGHQQQHAGDDNNNNDDDGAHAMYVLRDGDGDGDEFDEHDDIDSPSLPPNQGRWDDEDGRGGTECSEYENRYSSGGNGEGEDEHQRRRLFSGEEAGGENGARPPSRIGGWKK